MLAKYPQRGLTDRVALRRRDHDIGHAALRGKRSLARRGDQSVDTGQRPDVGGELIAEETKQDLAGALQRIRSLPGQPAVAVLAPASSALSRRRGDAPNASAGLIGVFRRVPPS